MTCNEEAGYVGGFMKGIFFNNKSVLVCKGVSRLNMGAGGGREGSSAAGLQGVCRSGEGGALL